MKYFSKFFIFFIPFLFLEVFAQKVWTLKECIDHAVLNNLQLQNDYLNIELSKNQLNQSLSQMTPTLNGNATNNINFGRAIDPYTNSFIAQKTLSNNFSVVSSFKLFDGFQLWNNFHQNRYNYISSKYDYEKSKNDIVLGVIAAYLQILYNEEQLSTVTQQMELSKLQVSRSKIQIDKGAISISGLLDAESQLFTEEAKVIDATGQLKRSYLSLSQLLNLTSPDFMIERPQALQIEEVLMDTSYQTTFDIALGNQPEIKSSTYKILAAKKGISAARGLRSPKLVIQGSISSGYSDNKFALIDREYYTTSGIVTVSERHIIPFNDQLNDNLGKFIGLSLNIPILNNFLAHNATQKAKINIKKAEINYNLIKHQLLRTIQEAHVDIRIAHQKYIASLKAKEAANEAFKYSQDKFDLGAINSWDYINSKNTLSKAESDLIQAKYELIFKKKIIDFYRGNLIF